MKDSIVMEKIYRYIYIYILMRSNIELKSLTLNAPSVPLRHRRWLIMSRRKMNYLREENIDSDDDNFDFRIYKRILSRKRFLQIFCTLHLNESSKSKQFHGILGREIPKVFCTRKRSLYRRSCCES